MYLDGLETRAIVKTVIVKSKTRTSKNQVQIKAKTEKHHILFKGDPFTPTTSISLSFARAL